MNHNRHNIPTLEQEKSVLNAASLIRHQKRKVSLSHSVSHDNAAHLVVPRQKEGVGYVLRMYVLAHLENKSSCIGKQIQFQLILKICFLKKRNTVQVCDKSILQARASNEEKQSFEDEENDGKSSQLRGGVQRDVGQNAAPA